jgi:DHA2 family integral membrane protein (MFS transporter)
VPLTLGLLMGAGSSSLKLVPRFGTTRIVTAGLVGQSLLLASTMLWSPGMSVWYLLFWFWAVALCMGWVMAPATASVMGAVPKEKSGVASAMNDVTRQVAGALGTAVIGSLITTFYSSRIDEHAATLSDSARTSAEESIGQANALAATLPADQGAHLTDAAATAFTDALGIAFLVASACAVLGAVAVKRWLPPRPVAEEPEVEETELRDAA